jgi:hypothetical protein
MLSDGILQGTTDELAERCFWTRSMCAHWQTYGDGISPLRTLPGIRLSAGDTLSYRRTPRMFAGHVPPCILSTGGVLHRGRTLLVERYEGPVHPVQRRVCSRSTRGEIYNNSTFVVSLFSFLIIVIF